MIEEMAKYSKQLWPTMPTIVRAQPNEVRWNGTYRYLDAAWAQYTTYKGDIHDYIRKHVADAQAMGLSLVVGLNTTKGGPGGREMTGAEAERYGSVLLSSTYSCAFINWQYNTRHLAQDDMKRAMALLSAKAANRSSRSCSRSGGSAPPPPPTLPGVSGIALKASAQVQSGVANVSLTWSGAAGAMVDLFRNGTYLRTMENDGRGLNAVTKPGTYSYRVCEAGKSRCSNTVSVTISLSGTSGIVLKAVRQVRDGIQQAYLTWSGASVRRMDLYRNGKYLRTMPNDGRGLNVVDKAGTYSYRVCEAGSSRCSNTASVTMF
jgi:hypothetical protein